MDDVSEAGQRLDRWLCNSRWFKTRGLAGNAIRLGRIEVNGAKAKPARVVRPGDILRICRPPYTYEIAVRASAERRLSAALAQQLYVETGASIRARERVRESLQLNGTDLRAPGGGDGRQRRQRRFARTFD